MSEWNHWETIDEKRMSRAKEKEMTPILLDLEHGTASFPSSDGGTYTATLEDCNCPDFSIQGGTMPCKHICRLAMEMGVIDNTGMESDIEVAEHKLGKGNLLRLARKGELLSTAALFHALFRITKRDKVNYSDFIGQYGELYLLSRKSNGQCVIEKKYVADVKSGCDQIKKRLGELVFDSINNPDVLSALRNTEDY